MEVEILLDVDEAEPAQYDEIEQRFRQWYAEGSEARYGRACYQRLTELKKRFRYQVDFGQADATRALQTLHGKLYRFGVKVFVHFLH